MRFIDQFGAILFDMCGTFMFGHDRVGPNEDFFATYLRLGGTRLTREQVTDAMRLGLDVIRYKYNSRDFYEDFPSVAEVYAPFVAEEDLPDVEAVFTAHEIGTIPAENEVFLREVAKSHWIGVVSNICAHPDAWVPVSPNVETFRAFHCLVFSSEGRTIKPARAIFDRALAAAPKDKPILFVGDDLNRDIIPAKSLGLGTAWISKTGSKHPDADVVVERLTDLATLGNQP
jgi:FMN phosphatase YigB (HAD superfamily)